MTTFDKTRDYEYEYLKSEIDIHINWLQFLNKYLAVSISEMGYLELPPKLEELRNELYNIYQNKEINKTIEDTQNDIKVDLEELISKKDYSEVAKYVSHIDSILSKKRVNELNIALFIRKCNEINYKNIDTLITILGESTLEKDLFLKDLLDKVKHTPLLSTFKVESVLPIQYYLNSLRIGYKSETLISYIYYNLVLIKKIAELFQEKLGNVHNLSDDVEILIDELDKDGKITNINCLIDIFVLLDAYLNQLIEKLDIKVNNNPTLQLAVKSDN